MWTSNLDAFVKAVNPCYCFYSYKDASDSEYRRFASSYYTASTLRKLAKKYNILGNRYNGTITYKVQYNTITVSARRHIKAKTIKVRNLSNGKIRSQKLVYNDAQRLFLDKRMLFSGTKLVTGSAEDRTPRASGWVKDSKGWRYMQSGKWLTGGWRVLDGKVYYFTASGYRHEGWLKLNGKTYFLNRLGVRMSGWQMIDGKFYYFSTKNAAMLTGRTWIGGQMWPLRNDGSLDLSKKKAPNINITTSGRRHTTK
jgi:glucan-binding YG repeat protein